MDTSSLSIHLARASSVNLHILMVNCNLMDITLLILRGDGLVTQRADQWSVRFDEIPLCKLRLIVDTFNMMLGSLLFHYRTPLHTLDLMGLLVPGGITLPPAPALRLLHLSSSTVIGFGLLRNRPPGMNQ